MFAQSLTAAIAVLGLATSATAAGVAHVVNNCGTEVFFASVGQGYGGGMAPLPSSGYSEAYSKPNVGISIKLASSASGPVTQFEFTWAAGNINYDISNINGNPFAQGGMSLVPSMAGASGFPSCKPVICPAGEATCTAAYNLPDDVRTMVCPDASDLTMTLCPNGPVKREVSWLQSLAKRVHARQFN